MPQNRWEFIQSWLMDRRSYNGAVNKYFLENKNDLDSRIINDSQDKEACLIKDDDSALVALHARLNFYFEKLKLLEAIYNPNVYGIPISAHQEQRKFKPQVLLYFKEDKELKPKNRRAVEGQIQFRLMEFTPEDIPPKSRVIKLSENIKREFGANNGYLWSRGKDLASYTDFQRGYSLQICSPDKNSAKDLIKKVLKINEHEFQPENMNYKVNESPETKYPQSSKTKRVYDKNYPQPVARRVTKVRFRYAILHLHGLPRPLVLADLTNRLV